MTRHIRLLACFVMVMAMPLAVMGAAENLIRNGSFENGLTSPWGVGQYGEGTTAWWVSGGARAQVQMDESVTWSGKPSLHINNDSGRAANVFGTTVQRVSVKPYQMYRVTLWAKGKGLASKGAISIVVDKEWKQRIINLPAGNFSWRMFDGGFWIKGNTAEFRLLSEDKGDVWISDIRMTPVDSAFIPLPN